MTLRAEQLQQHIDEAKIEQNKDNNNNNNGPAFISLSRRSLSVGDEKTEEHLPDKQKLIEHVKSSLVLLKRRISKSKD